MGTVGFTVTVELGLTVVAVMLLPNSSVQLNVYGPPFPPVAVAVSGIELPSQIEVDGVKSISNGGFTVITTQSFGDWQPLASVTLKQYDVVVVGVTIIGPVPLMLGGVQLIVYGAVPPWPLAHTCEESP